MTSSPVETEDALAAAVHRVSPFAQEGVLRFYRDHGWTAEHFEAVAALADWAIEHGTGSPLMDAGDRADRILFDQRTDYEIMWQFLVRERDMPRDLAVGWVAAVAATPDWRAYDAMEALLRGSHPRWQAACRKWRDVGLFGPRAYAAGLTLREARDRQAAGDWDAEELAVLTALRGWQFPTP